MIWRIAVVLVASSTACGRVRFDPVLVGDGNTNIVRDDAALIGGCGATQLLDDAFAGTAIDSSKWSVQQANGVTVTQNNGLLMTFATTVGKNQVGGVFQTTAHDIHGTCLVFRMLSMLDPLQAGYGAGGFQGPAGERLLLGVTRGQLQASKYVPGTVPQITTLMQRTYDPASDIVFRLSVLGGSYVWETSPDGMTFTTLASSSIAASGVDPTSAVVVLIAGTPNVTAFKAGMVSFTSVDELGP